LHLAFGLGWGDQKLAFTTEKKHEGKYTLGVVGLGAKEARPLMALPLAAVFGRSTAGADTFQRTGA
jgi:hypothetical protein